MTFRSRKPIEPPINEAFRYFTYVPLTCVVDMTASGQHAEAKHLRPLRDCMYSIDSRRRVLPFGFKFLMCIDIEYIDSTGETVYRTISVTGRQFLIRESDQRSFVKAKQVRENDGILIRLSDNNVGTARVIKVIRLGKYAPVAELCVRDRDMFSVDNVLTVALSKYRKKAKPIVSRGIIAYYVDELSKTIYYLIVRRRHTMAFLDFIRGKYFNNDRSSMCKIYLSQMTGEERAMLQRLSFDDLWNVVWGNQIGDRPNPRYMRQYRKCAHRWQQLDLVALMTDVTITPHGFPEYGWPKGRANKDETIIQTAMREFSEETGLAFDESSMVLDHQTANTPLHESFIGNNGIRYDHFYTLARIIHPPSFKEKLTPINLEIGSVEFQTYEDCLRLFRSDDTAKRRLLTDIHLDLTNSLAIKDCSFSK